jgi:hypothetical protein
VQHTPWSYVLRFATTKGYIYLKQTPKQLGLEAVINQVLHEQFHASVPQIIAHNAELNCFLMHDAGRSLREILKRKFDEALVCKAIEQFTALQLAAADHVDVLLNIGVPDWRLDKFPELYREVILQKDLLIAEGLSELEIQHLEKLTAKIAHLCQLLLSHPVKHTIVQPDFNDNNTLIDEASQVMTLIDLGEISISHPFFSLLNCLQQLRKHHGLSEQDDRYRRIKEVCFTPYLDSKESLEDAMATAEILWMVYGVLAQYRLMVACGKEKIMAWQPERLGGSLKELMSRI